MLQGVRCFEFSTFNLNNPAKWVFLVPILLSRKLRLKGLFSATWSVRGTERFTLHRCLLSPVQVLNPVGQRCGLSFSESAQWMV